MKNVQKRKVLSLEWKSEQMDDESGELMELMGSTSSLEPYSTTQTRTGPDQTRQCPRLRPGLRQSLVRVKFHYTDPRTWSATRPDETHGQSPYMLSLSGQVYDQTKSADLSETQAVRGSGLVGSV